MTLSCRSRRTSPTPLLSDDAYGQERHHPRERHLFSDLQRSEAFLAEGHKMSRIGTWSWNVTSGAIYWSEEQLSHL
jgi:hypothetical protein